MALETFVAPVRTDEKSVVKKGLHKVSSSGPVNGCAATGRATSGMSCTEYEFHDAPFRAKLHSVNRRCEGDGSNQTAVNPKREPQSYSQDTPYFNSTLLAALIAPISFEFPRNCPTSQTALSRLFNIERHAFLSFSRIPSQAARERSWPEGWADWKDSIHSLAVPLSSVNTRLRFPVKFNTEERTRKVASRPLFCVWLPNLVSR
jgi:hypothetical protein